MFTSLSRIIKSGWLNFWRNSWISVATMSIMMLTLFVITGLLFLNVAALSIAKILEDKVDISVYFHTDAKETDILTVKDELLGFKEIKSVEYVSRAEALSKFKERHKDNPLLSESLEELGGNPLEASLNIKAFEAASYEAIAKFLEGEKSYASLIDKINYRQNQEMIKRLFTITSNAQKAGIVFTIILALIAFLVAFNTIRMAIYNSKDEIAIMKLVGASNWFIQGPFVVQGILVGLFAGVLTFLISVGLLWFFSPKIEGFIQGLQLLEFLKTYFWVLLGVEIGLGVFFGAFSSLVAARKHLKI